MAELLADYEAWMLASGASADTVRARSAAARRLLAVAGTADPCEVQPQHLVRVLAAVEARWSKSTYYNHARNFAQWCEFAGLRVEFLTGIVKPRTPRGEPRPISATEFRKALAVSDSPTRMMFLLAGYAGLRVHEIARVRGEDVRDGKLYVVGKGGKSVSLPLHPVLATQAQTMPSSGWWFPGATPNRSVTRGTVWRHMHKALRAVGSEATPHMVRHLYGTTLLNSGNSMRATQTLLRHASLTSTQIYTEVSDQHLQAAIDSLPDYTQPDVA